MPGRSPPIGIRSIKVENFRQLDSLRLDFTGADDGPSDIVVVGGPNGCGKTTLLEACLIALGYEGELQGPKGREAVRKGGKRWELTAEVQSGGRQYKTVTRSDGRPYQVNVASPFDGYPAAPCLYFSSWRAPKLVGSLPITAGKRGKRPADTEPNRIWRTKQNLIDGRAHKLMSQGTELEGSDVYVKNLHRLNAVWAEFHPRSDEEFVVEPVGTDPSDGFDVFLHRRGGQKVAVDALSSGQLELFALFGALMLAKFSEGVVVIDEPELHLDPQWHALMIRAIRQFLPSAQLLIATHSPKVYDSVMSFQRHFLVPESDPRADHWKSVAAVGT